MVEEETKEEKEITPAVKPKESMEFIFVASGAEKRLDASYFTRRDFKDFIKKGKWKLPGKLNPEEIKARAKGKSSHGLFEALAKTEDRKKSILVKPYVLETQKNIRRLNNEFKNMVNARDRGISRVKPLGIYKESKKDAEEKKAPRMGYLYLEPEEHSLPLSALNYKLLKEEKRKRILQRIGEKMKECHDKQLVFPDAKLRNILIDLGEKGLRIDKDLIKEDRKSFRKHLEEYDKEHEEQIILNPIDLEKSSFVSGREPNQEEKGYDIATITGNMVYHNLIQDEKDLEMFLKSYVHSGKPEEQEKEPTDLPPYGMGIKDLNEQFREEDENKEVENWKERLENRLKRHQRDINIQNLKEILEKK